MILRRFVLRADQDWTKIVKNIFTFLKGLARDESWEIRVLKFKEDKTGEQRAFFHVLCGLLGEEIGYTKNQMKEAIKAETLGTTKVILGEIEVDVIPSTESLRRDEYALLIQQTYVIATDLGIILPLPRFRT